MRFEVKEVLGNGAERCELRWPLGEHFEVEDYIGDWRRVRNVDFSTNQATGEAVLSFIRNVSPPTRTRRPPRR
jgi:hypothetical protein